MDDRTYLRCSASIRLDGYALSEMGSEDDVNDDAWALDAGLGVFVV